MASDLFADLQEFIGLKQRLLAAVKQQFPEVEDWDGHELYSVLRNKPREMHLDRELWRLRPHGTGCCFTRKSDGLELDVSTNMGSHPSAFDGWALMLHLESKYALPEDDDDKPEKYRLNFLEDWCKKLHQQEQARYIGSHRLYELVTK